MIYKVFKITNHFENIPVYCYCSFCHGQIMRTDIDHYKLYSDSEEQYYLNIDNKNSLVELQQKL